MELRCTPWGVSKKAVQAIGVLCSSTSAWVICADHTGLSIDSNVVPLREGCEKPHEGYLGRRCDMVGGVCGSRLAVARTLCRRCIG